MCRRFLLPDSAGSNGGRGREYFAFRSFLMRNLRLDPARLVPTRQKVLVHLHSSRRSGSFKRRIKALREAFARSGQSIRMRGAVISSLLLQTAQLNLLGGYGSVEPRVLLRSLSR